MKNPLEVRRERGPDELAVEPLPPAGHALLSVLVPGLGQLAQGRRLTAAVQFGTVATYLASAYAVGGGRALWLAVAWNAWSAVEAYWRAPR